MRRAGFLSYHLRDLGAGAEEQAAVVDVIDLVEVWHGHGMRGRESAKYPFSMKQPLLDTENNSILGEMQRERERLREKLEILKTPIISLS